MVTEPLIITLYALLQAAFCALSAVLIALPTGYFLWRYSFPGQRLLHAFLYVGSVMPTKAAALAVDLCYQVHGWVGISCGMLIINIPFAILLMHQVYGCIDRLSLLVAAGLGASPWQRYRDIIWPQIYPAVKMALSTIFILCFCAVSFTPVLGNQWYHATPDGMMQHAYQAGDTWQVIIYGCLRLLCVVSVGYGATRAKNASLITHVPLDHTRQRYRLLNKPWWALLLGVVVLSVCVPLVALMRYGVSVGMLEYLYGVIIGRPDFYGGVPVWYMLYQSIGIACVSGIGAVLMSALLCWARVYACGQARSIQLLGLAPFLIGGVGCGMLFDQLAQIKIITPVVAMMISHMVMNYPLAYQLMYAQSAAYDPEWTYCAQSLGASMRSIYKNLYVPFMLPAAVNAWCLSISLSLTEVGAASVVSDKTLMTLSMALRIYRAAGYEAGMLGIVCIIGCLVCLCALGASRIQRSFIGN